MTNDTETKSAESGAETYELETSDIGSVETGTITATSWEDAKLKAELAVEGGNYGDVTWHRSNVVNGNVDWSMFKVRITLTKGDRSEKWSYYAEDNPGDEDQETEQD